MTHRPMDPLILDQMYEHPERFGHLDKTEYFRLLIEDIRYWRGLLEPTHRKAAIYGDAYLQVSSAEEGFTYRALPPEAVTVFVQT